MSAEEFIKWLQALLTGDDERRASQTRPTLVTEAQEYVNGELRPCLVAFFPGGGFVITVNTVGNGDGGAPRFPERPTPIPKEWTVIDYRKPVRGEQYFVKTRMKPLEARQLAPYLEDRWIVVPTRPHPIPDGWRVVAYREPKNGERYFNQNPRSIPFTGGVGTMPGNKWIVESAA